MGEMGGNGKGRMGLMGLGNPFIWASALGRATISCWSRSY